MAFSTIAMDVDFYEFYLGSAFVPLQSLYYAESESYQDSCTGCCIRDTDHNLPALIQFADLRTIINDNGIETCELYHVVEYPKLKCTESYSFPCLHGEFRLRNARSNGHDPLEWWAVDFYSLDMPYRVSNCLRQSYRNHTALCDGEIYLRVRYYQRRNAAEEVTVWASKLSKSKQNNINQILRKDRLRQILDNLEPFRGLWRNFQLGSFPPILSWRCFEEIEAYLSRLIKAWEMLTLGNAYWCDHLTVQRLQGLAPTWSVADYNKIKTLISESKVLMRADRNYRENILQNWNQLPEFIPSFATFFKHTKIIGPSMLALRYLLPNKKARPSMNAAFSDCYKTCYEEISCLVQYSDNEERQIRTTRPVAVKLAYMQVFLTALRQSESILIQGTLPESSGWLSRLACTADRLGFKTDAIRRMRECNADILDIRLNMRRERPEALFRVDQSAFEDEALLRNHRQVIFERRMEPASFCMTAESALEPRSRVDFHSLYLPNILAAMSDKKKGLHLSAFGRLALILSLFFDGFEGLFSHITDMDFHATLPSGYTSIYSGVEETADFEAPLIQQSISPKNVVFVQLRASSTADRIVRCPNTVLAVGRILNNLRSRGFKTLLILTRPHEQDLNANVYLKKIRPQAWVIVRLRSQLQNLEIFFCTPADLRNFIGKRLKDIRSVYTLVADIRASKL